MFALEMLGVLFIVFIIAGIIVGIIAAIRTLCHNSDDVKRLQSRVKFLEDTLHSVLCREKKKIEAEKKIAICNIKKK